MRSWSLVIVIVVLCALVVYLRSKMREGVTRWAAERLGGGAARARAKALLWYGSASAAAIAVLIAGYVVARAGGSVAYLRFVAAFLVFVLFVPVATLGAPKLTKWQKNFGRRLHEAGAAREAAEVFARVARVFSVVGVLCGVGAVLLVAHHTP
ncbi:hypothetical protein EVU97_08770 [Dermacoccus sp. 147Ba]|uniref:hypothetical protein n=1 Tax=Dermacoccus sp. 147Ba TaxID=2510111 RepID=UPI00101B6476|nr:hypothetical protein [Dermacoccus sp. 147Ba]RYI22464.1 hypothetical protein EVU97_08770 [Dermacoccus sp. 147Ba]